MHIWLINPYGPIPGEGWRDYRYTMIGETLAKHGYQVTWWTANFSHHFKRFRSQDWTDISISPGFQIRLVPTSGYYRNISLARVWFETVFAWRVYHRAKQESSPDCIITPDAIGSVGYLAVKLAKRFQSRLVFDVFDLWPELFVIAFPRLFRPFASIALLPLYAHRRYNLRQAHAITAVCDTYLDVARKETPHLRPSCFKTIYIGIDVRSVREQLESFAVSETAQELGKLSNEVWAVYAGSLGDNYDIDTLLHAAMQLTNRASYIKIIIAGDGPLRQHIINFIKSHQLTNLIYVGKLSPDELARYYRICDIALSPYVPQSTVAMPTKVYDYFAAGLPIINSLSGGEVEEILRDNQIGIQYTAGDAKSLANALEELASDADKRRTMSRNSYDAAMMFDRQAQYLKLLNLIG